VLEQQRGAWLAPLTAVTRLGVSLGAKWEGDGAEGSALQGKVQGLLGQVQAWPAGLQQVVVVRRAGSNGTPFKLASWHYSPAAPGGALFSVWLEQHTGFAPGWAQPLRPCPHLPGVWELQGEVDGSSE
jgi:hypothetical protein